MGDGRRQLRMCWRGNCHAAGSDCFCQEVTSVWCKFCARTLGELLPKVNGDGWLEELPGAGRETTHPSSMRCSSASFRCSTECAGHLRRLAATGATVLSLGLVLGAACVLVL